MKLKDVGNLVYRDGLGATVDRIDVNNIKDKHLTELVASTHVVLNEIQLYLEEKLGVEFFE